MPFNRSMYYRRVQHLADTEREGVLLTEAALIMGAKAAVKKKRRSLAYKIDKKHIPSDYRVLNEIVTDEEIVKNTVAISLTPCIGDDPREVKGELKPLTTVDVRTTKINLDELHGYTEEEREFIIERIEQYKEHYNLKTPNEQFLVTMLTHLELCIAQLMMMQIGRIAEKDFVANIKEYQTMYQKISESLSFLRKQQKPGETEQLIDTGDFDEEDINDLMDNEEDEEKLMMKKYINM